MGLKELKSAIRGEFLGADVDALAERVVRAAHMRQNMTLCTGAGVKLRKGK
jgi:hypothetical protein